MYRVLIALLLALAGCASAPSSDPAPQLPVQSSPATSASAVVSSGSAPSVQFAGRLTFPASTDWTEKIEGGDRAKIMKLEYAPGGKKCRPGECPMLMLYTEAFSEWDWQFASDKSCSDGVSMYALPVRYTEGDITLSVNMGAGKMGNRVGEYYNSDPCPGTPTGKRHTWLFKYEDANGNQRVVMINGYTTANPASSNFPYLKVVNWIRGWKW